MAISLQKALAANRESRYLDFKQQFNPQSRRDWCEITKDIVAISNSGGGVLLIGLDDSGNPAGADVNDVLALDPAEWSNKIGRYIGTTQISLEVVEAYKSTQKIAAILVGGSSLPIVFNSPGTYDVGGGKQDSAFGRGTLYFRHGAKSEPATDQDIRRSFERHLEQHRRSWLRGIRKVVEAPVGSEIVAVRTTGQLSGSPVLASTVRAVKDPDAIPILLTRDESKAQGTFVHEELSEGIFDEINNVIDANRVLGQGQTRFFLEFPVYYRIYAERFQVKQPSETIRSLFQSAVTLLNAPAAHWIKDLSDVDASSALSALYLQAKQPHIYFLLKAAILFGPDAYMWLFKRFERKWKQDAQPPKFYWTFKQMITKAKTQEPLVIAARIPHKQSFQRSDGTFVVYAELLKDQRLAEEALSHACRKVFSGNHDFRGAARTLDVITHAELLQNRGRNIMQAMQSTIGDKLPGVQSSQDDVGNQEE